MTDNVYIQLIKKRISEYEKAIKELEEKEQDLQTTQLEIKVEELHSVLGSMQKLGVEAPTLFDDEIGKKIKEMADKIETILLKL